MSTATDYFDSSVVYESTAEGAIYTLHSFIATPPEFVVWDTETTSLDPWAGKTIFNSHRGNGWKTTTGGVVFSVQLGLYDKEQDKLFCVFVNAEDVEEMKLVREILGNPDTLKIGHNVKFDVQMCERSGIPVRGKLWDTLTASRLTHDQLFKHDLKSLGNYFAGTTDAPDKWDEPIKKWLSDAKRKNSKWSKVAFFEKTGVNIKSKHPYIKDFVNYSMVPEDIMIPYGLADVWYTFLLFISMQKEIEDTYADLFEMEMEYINVAMAMEATGVEIDRPRAMKAKRWLLKKADTLLTEMRTIALKHGRWDYNPNSSPQTIALLRNLGVTENDLKNKAGKTSADSYVIAKVTKKYSDVDFIAKSSQYRTCIKLANTYHDTFIQKTVASGNTLRFNLRCSDTATGRSSCANPNLQNIPNPENEPNGSIPTRSVFRVREGYTNLYLDYSQIEMVIFALFCQEEGILEAVLNKEDLHSFTANKLIEAGILPHDGTDESFKRARSVAKTTNFAIIYGAGIQKVADQLSISYQESSEFRESYFRLFPGVESFIERCESEIYQRGYVEDIFGKRYHLDAQGSYKAPNRVIQGCAANVLKTAAIQVQRVCTKYDWQPLLPIHDELWVQVPTDAVGFSSRILRSTMEHIETLQKYDISVDVDVETSTTYWSDKELLEISRGSSIICDGYFNSPDGKGYLMPYTAGEVTWFM